MKERIRIFVGAYGSGKTEVAVNYAFALRQQQQDVVIADLDIVNPYFRSRELRDAFEARGIRVVAPVGELAHADLPIITPMVRGAIQEETGSVLILNVGGDAAGSRALSQFAVDIGAQGYDMAMVINDRRPWTSTVEGIQQAIARVEENSRLRVTVLVSNPNLAAETTPEIVHKGHDLVLEASKATGLPIIFLSVMGALAGDLDESRLGSIPMLRLERHLLPPWYEDPLRFAPYHDRRAHVMAADIRNRRAGPADSEVP